MTELYTNNNWQAFSTDSNMYST